MQLENEMETESNEGTSIPLGGEPMEERSAQQEEPGREDCSEALGEDIEAGVHAQVSDPGHAPITPQGQDQPIMAESQGGCQDDIPEEPCAKDGTTSSPEQVDGLEVPTTSEMPTSSTQLDDTIHPAMTPGDTDCESLASADPESADASKAVTVGCRTFVVPLTPEEIQEAPPGEEHVQYIQDDDMRCLPKEQHEDGDQSLTNGLRRLPDLETSRAGKDTIGLLPKNTGGIGRPAVNAESSSKDEILKPGASVGHKMPAFVTLGPTEAAEAGHDSSKGKEKTKGVAFRDIVAITVALFIVVGMTFILVVPSTKSDVWPTSAPSKEVLPTGRSSYPPSSLAPEKITAIPTHPLQELLNTLPVASLQNIKIHGTPQRRAFDWLSSHETIDKLPEWRRLQLFALVTFYYAMHGPRWPLQTHNAWLNDSISECQWQWMGVTSSQYALSESKRYKQPSAFMHYNSTPCNEEGAIQSLVLSNLDFTGHQAFVPAEVAFLTSLSILALPGNNINASTNELLPTDLFQMTQLSVLDLQSNRLHGPIPTQVGLMGNLTTLLLANNHLLASNIPIELGLLSSTLTTLALGATNIYGFLPRDLKKLTALRYLDLHDTQIIGPLRSELHSLENLKVLDLHNTFLTGTIPTELQILNTSLDLLSLQGTHLDGTVPSTLCNITTLLFDCSEILCGCDCACGASDPFS